MQVVKVRKAIESGQLDPAAKEAALLIAKGREEVNHFLMSHFWRFAREEMTEEEIADYRLKLESYLQTCRLLMLDEEWIKIPERHLRMLVGFNEDPPE